VTPGRSARSSLAICFNTVLMAAEQRLTPP
jgi:hypothetical protein